jgi:hypothetical protein
MRIAVLFFISFLLAQNMEAQDWGIHLHVNELYPIANSEQGYYPILWFSSAESSSVLVGGFGIGISRKISIKEKLPLKLQLNVARSRYYDSATVLTDANGAALGAFLGVNTNYHASLLGMPTWTLTKKEKLKLGVGLGLRYIFSSKTDFGETFINGDLRELKINKLSEAPFVLFLPIELSYSLNQFTFGIRGELGLTKSTKLANLNDRNFLLVSELTYSF